MFDPFGRSVSYLRVSVTDRCDFRCTYCMSEDMTFLPKANLLSLEELERLCAAFIRKGVRKIRITGGEPLVRRNVMSLFKSLGHRLNGGGLDELTVTTNGSQLSRFAADLKHAGVRRVNVSLDTLNPAKFTSITRWGKIEPVLEGIESALKAGLKVKINTVALRGINEDEIPDLMTWSHAKGMDFTLIETMPLGEVEGDRIENYLPLSLVRAQLSKRFTLQETDYRTGGPARYLHVAETGGRLGLITPLTHNFCESCNRVRLTCTGTLFMCLGQGDNAEFRQLLRQNASDTGIDAAIDEAISRKPKGHDFVIDRSSRAPAVARHMSMTGG